MPWSWKFGRLYAGPIDGGGVTDPHELSNKRMPKAGWFNGIEIPASLQANVDRHHANLFALVETLGKAGLDEATIEMSVNQIIASYQAELVANMKALHRSATDD